MSKSYSYRTQGTCSQQINIEMSDDNSVIENVEFIGGCDGNLQGICRLIKGQTADEVIAKVGGIKCGFKDTSCPDQLARALAAIKEQK